VKPHPPSVWSGKLKRKGSFTKLFPKEEPAEDQVGITAGLETRPDLTDILPNVSTSPLSPSNDTMD